MTWTEPPFEIDVTVLVATPVPLPDGAKVVEMASDGVRLCVLATKPGGALTLFERTSGTWRERALPERSDRDEKLAAVVAVRKDLLVVLAGGRLWSLEGERWSSRVVPARPNAWFHTLVDQRRLYVARDDGEFGGDLVSIGVDGGAWVEEPLARGRAEPNPVRGLVAGPDGALWAVLGIAHLGQSEGELLRRDARGWSLVASATANGWDSGQPGVCGGDWNLPSTDFDALAFDAAGKLFLSTGKLGLVRREPTSGWTRLPRPPAPIVYHEGLQIIGDKAVIGTFDDGVFVTDLGSGQVTRVPLTPKVTAPR